VSSPDGSPPFPALPPETSHPPEARLHKWEARKDLGVVSAWIEATTRPGELVVDPFMGAGTAPLAAARLGRRAVGVDLSPLAVRLASLAAAPPDPAAVAEAFARIEARLLGPSPRLLALPDGGRLSLADLFRTRCPGCGGAATLAHAVWSVRIACGCGAVTPAHELVAGGGRGTAAAKRCPACGAPPSRGGDAYRGEVLYLRIVRCAACGLLEAPPEEADLALAARLEAARNHADVWTPAGVPLRYPDGAPLAQLRHSLRARPVLDELWTGRNFLATGLLAEAIDGAAEGEVREALRTALSAVVKATSRMPTRNTGGWKNKGTGLSSHLLGVFPLHLEQHPWEEFERHVRTRLLPGLAAARTRPPVRLVERFPLEAGELRLVPGDSRRALAALPAESAALVFADPPYGDAVQYAELSVPNLAWLARPLAGHALAEHVGAVLAAAREAEAVENRAQGKDRAAFARLLGEVLAGARRVLRPGGAAVITFNSPEDELVRTVIVAAEGAGLPFAGVHHQDAFKPSHKGAWHPGTARGTLYLRFTRP
jgi:SAM-dependent methyltransferase